MSTSLTLFFGYFYCFVVRSFINDTSAINIVLSLITQYFVYFNNSGPNFKFSVFQHDIKGNKERYPTICHYKFMHSTIPQFFKKNFYHHNFSLTSIVIKRNILRGRKHSLKTKLAKWENERRVEFLVLINFLW